MNDKANAATPSAITLDQLELIFRAGIPSIMNAMSATPHPRPMPHNQGATAMQIMSFTAACKHYFGYRPQQTLGEFMAEVKELTPEDRAYFTKLFPSVGIEIAKLS